MSYTDAQVQAAAERMKALYGENKVITDGNYDRSLAVRCINGTFVGQKKGDVIAFRGIPFVGKQPVGEYRWKAPVDFEPDDGVYEAYYFGTVPSQNGDIMQIGSLYPAQRGLPVSERMEGSKSGGGKETGHRMDPRRRF